MRIVHVLSYVSKDGSYGGPVAVAVGQCRALARAGHDVTLLAGWDGQAILNVPGVDVQLHRAARLPGLGFAGLVAPTLIREVPRLARHADVFHFHLARDIVQLPAGRALAGAVPFVTQPHGMIVRDERRAARLLDRLLTRPILRRSHAQLALTERESEELTQISPSSPVLSIRNGVGVPSTRASWVDECPTVVYLARLQTRKRPVEFVRMAAQTLTLRHDVRFHLYGADEGEASAVCAAIQSLRLQDAVEYRGALAPDDVSRVLADAQAYVLPSVDEPFPMSLLEAMSHGLPSVITDRTGISAEVAARGTALVTNGSAEQMAAALLTVLATPEAWRAASDAARQDIEANFSVQAVVETLLAIYTNAIRAEAST